MDRKSELDQFKKLNLSLIASDHGYVIDKQKSTRHSVLMSSGSDKIIVSKKGPTYVYCSVFDSTSNGTVIDFASKVIEPGCSLGRVRQLLRPYLGTDYLNSIQLKQAGSFAAQIKSNKTDLKAVADRFSRFSSITERHPYLCDVRGVPLELLVSNRLRDSIKVCSKGTVIFPHWGCPTGSGSKERSLVGYEIKGQGVNMFSKSGSKGLWISNAMKHDRSLAIAESGLDAISYLAMHDDNQTRVVSLSGKMNSQQPDLLKSAIERMGEGAQIVAAFDNDKAGDELTQKLSDLVSEVGRSDLIFKEDRPLRRGADWNEVLLNVGIKSNVMQDRTTAFER